MTIPQATIDQAFNDDLKQKAHDRKIKNAAYWDGFRAGRDLANQMSDADNLMWRKTCRGLNE